MPLVRSLLILMAAALLAGTATAQPRPTPAAPEALRDAIQDALVDPATSNAFVGVMVLDLATGDTLFQQYAGKSFVPASNAKLYTTAAALDQLGTTYRYRTRLYATGPVRDGILFGDLVVRGSGDPTVAPRFHAGDAAYVFDEWADSLRAAGIDSVAGRILGDDNVFDDRVFATGWSWEDIPYWYSAEVTGLPYHDNSIDVTVATGTPGSAPSIAWEPFESDYVHWQNALETLGRDADRDEDYARALEGNLFTLSGSLPEATVDRTSLAVHDPTGFFAHSLLRRLQEQDIGVAGPALNADALSDRPDYEAPSTRRLATYTSPPLTDVVEAINKRSQNLYAELLLKTLGAERPVAPEETQFDEQTPGSWAMGVGAAMRTFAHAGLDTARLRLLDGSGLSRRDLVTPRMTTKLLAFMWDHPDPATKVAFVRSLPIGGVDGTLRRRFRGEAAYRQVRAKTGTLTGVSSLSGYVSRPSGDPIAFSIMFNHHTTDADAARAVQDAVVNVLARHVH